MAGELLPPLYPALRAAPDVVAILGDPPSAYPHGTAPQGKAPPYVVWSTGGSDPAENLSDLPPADRVGLQVDCYAGDGPKVEALAKAVRAALQRVCTYTGLVADLKEPATGFFRISMQFDYWL